MAREGRTAATRVSHTRLPAAVPPALTTAGPPGSPPCEPMHPPPTPTSRCFCSLHLSLVRFFSSFPMTRSLNLEKINDLKMYHLVQCF